MKFQIFIFVIGLFNVIPTDGRLIQKNKTRNVEESQTEKPNPLIRLTREIENDSLTGFSKEESVQSEEFIKSYNRRARYFIKAKPKASKTQAQKKTRISRESMESTKADPKIKIVNDLQKPTNTKPKAVLVKVPIPKFHDKDYDDFQSKISKSHILADSGDHEDEDFNLEDYDFDINHDEFTSGRKPLEPRMNVKNVEGDTIKSDMKTISKVVVPTGLTGPKIVSIKKERAADLNSKKTADTTKDLDYYDDITTTKSPEIITKAQDDEYSDENDDSKELDRKNSSIRTVRSWNVNLFGDKFHDKMSKVMTKFLGVLPLFPQIPNYYYNEEENPEASDGMTDPLTGGRFLM